MPKRLPVLPVQAAKSVAVNYGCKQVIVAAWDGALTHIVTYGETVEDCDQAAIGGDMIKAALGWPKDLNAEPSRVKKLKEEVAALKAEIAKLKTTRTTEETPAWIKPDTNTYKAYVVEMTEMDFGQRPEGFMLFGSKELALAFIREKTAGRTGPTPESYVRYDYDGERNVTVDLYKRVWSAGGKGVYTEKLKAVIT